MPINPLTGVFTTSTGRRIGTSASQRLGEDAEKEEQLRAATQVLEQSQGGVLSGLFNVLDLPGSMIRDVTAGENPIDQLLSPFSSKNRHSYIPEDAGLTDGSFYGGLAAEIALDPLTYLTGGLSAAKTVAGKAAYKLGYLDDIVKAGAKSGKGKRVSLLQATAGDLGKEQQELLAKRLGRPVAADERLASGFGFRGPGFQKNFGFGERSLRNAERLDKLGGAIRESAVGREAHRLFSPLARNFSDLTSQLFAKDVTQAQREGIRAGRKLPAAMRSAVTAAEIIKDTDKSGKEILRSMNKQEVRRVLEGAGEIPANAPDDMRKFFEDGREYLDGMKARVEANGGTLGGFSDETELLYSPRSATFSEGRHGTRGGFDESGAVAAARFGKSKAKNPHSIRRAQTLRNIHGGTESVRGIIMDEDLNNLINQKADKATVAARLAEKFSGIVPETFETSSGKTINQREALADLMMNLTPEERKVGLFGNDPLYDLRLYSEHVEGMIATHEKSLEWIAQIAEEGGEGVKVGRVLDDIGLKMETEGGGGALAAIRKHLGADIDADVLREMTLPKEMADAVTGLNKAFSDPVAAKKVTNWLDSLTNWFKATVTVPWPSFNVRNLYGGQAVNWISGHYSSLRSAASTYNQIDKFATGASKVIPAAKELPGIQEELVKRSMQLTDENATRVLMEGEFVDDLVHRTHMTPAEQEKFADMGRTSSGVTDVTDSTVREIQTGEDKLLGEDKFPTVLHSLKTAVGLGDEGVTGNLLDVRGVGGRKSTKFAPVVAGEQITQRVELLNRLTPYIELQKQGYSAKKAAEMVKASQVDYSAANFTEFERNTLKRLFPFYAWQSKMLPFTVRSMVEKPQLRALVRGEQRLSESPGAGGDPDTYVPERYKRQPALLMGDVNEQGYQNVLSGLDLAHNAALEPFQFGPTLGGTLSRMGRGIAGSSHPLAKLLLEQGMGVSTFSGRNTQGLEGGFSTIAKNVAENLGLPEPPKIPQPIDNLLLSLGGSRIAAPLRNLTDPRISNADAVFGKFIPNFLTGAKVSTFSPEQEKTNALKDYVRETGQAGRDLGTYERFFIPKHRKEVADPDTVRNVEALNLQSEISRAENDKRTKERERVEALKEGIQRATGR